MKRDLEVYLSDSSKITISCEDWDCYKVEKGVLYVRYQDTGDQSEFDTSYAFAKGEWRFIKVVRHED
jgi:hypothetical protein